MARDYSQRATRYLTEAINALSDGDNATCVRHSQEALELAAKAVLRRLGVEYPREHDVSEALVTVMERLPDYLKSRTDELKAMLAKLAEVRGPAFYGYEEQGIPAGQAFTGEYATDTVEKVKPLIELCVKFAMEPPSEP